ncbi:hypothetical protein SNOG_03882 [Parastagonospora nodorum SN15]|uniref:Manganese/iron superoxide dismutase C-terminal domain-containing protein n=1 Tax=Phaeosphaeria nodorum (strain SN15 / ATCC MYA-4574 / FGSC 10173) TaxID=321614 RepID=Q0UWI2_PHANO|nr:hypothetical protein SNOG_03882 [Parastagonospora nodorum SN15]EAT89087.1 hypothetical protein SNOG_03882 [Parastagonospora nodorum SN15]
MSLGKRQADDSHFRSFLIQHTDIMILRCMARRPGAVQSLASASRQTPSFVRTAYTVPTLDKHVEMQKNGVPGLFTPKGFNTAYTEYQKYMIDELNESTAAWAFINQLILPGPSTRNPRDPVQSPSPEAREPSIGKHFSSLENFCARPLWRRQKAMFGPGFVWLVQTNDAQLGSLRILPTYLAGSPLAGAHYRRQSHDLNTHNADSYQALNTVGTFGSAAKQNLQPKKPLGGVDVVPLLCVNTWEHAWLHDYGVRGKRQYLEAWWDKIDWNWVRQNATMQTQQKWQF